MAKARIKVDSLPPAPKPTKPYDGGDPWDHEYRRRGLENRDNLPHKDNRGHVPFWDRPRVAKLHRLWNEGYGIKHIMRNVAAPNEEVVIKRLQYDMKEGRIQPRKKTLTDDELAKVKRMKDAGMDLVQIAKEMRMSVFRLNKILKGENQK